MHWNTGRQHLFLGFTLYTFPKLRHISSSTKCFTLLAAVAKCYPIKSTKYWLWKAPNISKSPKEQLLYLLYRLVWEFTSSLVPQSNQTKSHPGAQKNWEWKVYLNPTWKKKKKHCRLVILNPRKFWELIIYFPWIWHHLSGLSGHLSSLKHFLFAGPYGFSTKFLRTMNLFFVVVFSRLCVNLGRHLSPTQT